MKRTDLIRHIEKNGCRLIREGGNHTFYINPRTNRRSTVPRHREINKFTAIAICRQLEIPDPR